MPLKRLPCLKFTTLCILSLYVYGLKWQDEIKFITRHYIIQTSLPRALYSPYSSAASPGNTEWWMCVFAYRVNFEGPCNTSVKWGLLAGVFGWGLEFRLPVWFPGSLKHIAFLACFPFQIRTWRSFKSRKAHSDACLILSFFFFYGLWEAVWLRNKPTTCFKLIFGKFS